MPGQQHPPTTPSPKSGRTGKITDFFKSVHQSEPKHAGKREIEANNQEDAQPAKKLKRSDDGHATSIRTARYKVNVDTPEPKTRKPASARLLDDTDGGLRDSVVGRWNFLEETSAEDVGPVGEQHPKSSTPFHAPVHANKPRRKRPASSRLLDDVDGGLLESLGGRFETPRYEEEVSRDGEQKRIDGSPQDTVNDNAVDDDTVDEDTEVGDSEAETIKAYDSERDVSGDENRDNEDSDEDSDEGEDSEGDDSDKENVDPRDRSRAPSPPSLPATPGHHGNQSHEAGDATPSNQPTASPSSLLLPSPVVDLPPLPSSPSSSSTLVPVPPSTMPSPPSSP